MICTVVERHVLPSGPLGWTEVNDPEILAEYDSKEEARLARAHYAETGRLASSECFGRTCTVYSCPLIERARTMPTGTKRHRKRREQHLKYWARAKAHYDAWRHTWSAINGRDPVEIREQLYGARHAVRR